MSSIFTEQAIQEIEQIAERIAARSESEPRPSVELFDEKTLAEIRALTIISHKPYLTKKELAVYLNVSTRSIAEWMARPHDQNPLPASNAGGEPRFQRQRVDEWADRENQRRRLRLAG